MKSLDVVGDEFGDAISRCARVILQKRWAQCPIYQLLYEESKLARS